MKKLWQMIKEWFVWLTSDAVLEAINNEGMTYEEVCEVAKKEQETGKNIEDLGIRAELAKIGIRMDEWLQEEMVLTDEQEAALKGGKR